MGFLTALTAVGSLLQVNEARQARQAQNRKLKKQETLARETARLETTVDDTGADIALGAEGQNTAIEERRRRAVRQVTGAPVGGTAPVSVGMSLL